MADPKFTFEADLPRYELSDFLDPKPLDPTEFGAEHYVDPPTESAANVIVQALRDRAFQDVNAVADRNQNNLAQSGFNYDVNNLNYSDFALKYGEQAANERVQILSGKSRLIEAERATDDPLTAAHNQYAQAAIELYRSFGNIGNLVVGSIEGGQDRAAELLWSHGHIVDSMLQRNLSENLKKKQYFNGIASQLDQADTQAQYDQEVAEGSNKFMAGMRQVGRDALNATERTLADPALTGNIISSGVGSLYASVPLAGGGGLIAKGATAALTRNLVAQRVAYAVGANVGANVGLELPSVYAQAASEVMNMDTAKLLETSKVMKALVAEGMTPEEAKAQLAGMTAETAALRQIVPSLAFGMIGARFEAMPLGYFAESGVTRGLLKIIGEGVEETGQEFSGAINQNMAIEKYTEVGRRVLEGAGENAALGMLGGLGTAGVAAGGPALVGGARRVVGGAVATANALTADPGTLDPNSIAGRANVAANNLLSAGREAATAIGAEVGPAVTVAADIAENLSPKAREERRQNQTAAQKTAEIVTQVQADLANDTALDEGVRTRLLTPSTDDAPAGFADVAGKKTVLENVSGILSKLSQRRFKMSEEDALYAASQVRQLKAEVASLPEGIREQVAGILDSTSFSKIDARIAELDLNDSPLVPKDEASPVTPNEVTVTAEMARINPSNVNPTRVKKILKESGENLSEEDIQYMRVAQEVAQAINDRVDNAVEIAKEKNVRLRKAGKAPTEQTRKENVERSVLVEGYVSKRGMFRRSVQQFASEIIQAIQSPTGQILTAEGNIVELSSLVSQFKDFVTHLNNKVQALNISYDENAPNQNGELRGPSVSYRGLSDDGRFKDASEWRNPVFHHRGSPGSVANAKMVANDLKTAAAVYQALLAAFPEQMQNLQLDPLVELKTDPEPSQQPTAPDESLDATSVQSEEGNQTVDGVELTQEENDALRAENEANAVENPTADEAIEDEFSEEPTDAPAEVVDEENSAERAEAATKDLSDLTLDEVGNFSSLVLDGRRLDDGGMRLALTPDEIARLREVGLDVSDNGTLTADAVQALEDERANRQKGSTNETTETADATPEVEETTEEAPVSEEVGSTEAVEVTESEESTVEPTRSIRDLASEIFNRVFPKNPNTTVPETYDEVKEVVEGKVNPAIVKAVEALLPFILPRLNKKLNRVTTINGKKATLREHLKDPKSEIHTYHHQYGALHLVDPETGQYNEEMVKLALMALMDFIVTAQQNDPNRFEDTLEKLGLTMSDVTDQQLEAFMFGMNAGRAKRQMGDKLVKYWGLKANKKASEAEIQGISQGFAAELLSVMSQVPIGSTPTQPSEFKLRNSNKESLFRIVQVPLADDANGTKRFTMSLVLNMRLVKEVQNKYQTEMEPGMKRTFGEFFFNDERELYVIGEEISQEGRHKNNTPTERRALAKMENTPHYKDGVKVFGFQMFGYDGLLDIFGFTPDVDEQSYKTRQLRISKQGQNIAIEYNVREAMELAEQLEDKRFGGEAVRYPHRTTKVGRHQAEGINYQSNKVLRALITPTWSTLDMKNQEDHDSFWLAVAQAADLFKIEKKNHAWILANVKQKFAGKWGVVKDMIKENMLDPETHSEEALTQAVLKIEPEGIEPQILAAIIAVADMERNLNEGNTTFQTSLSVEIDGLTNGAANMMVNFGQGTLSRDNYHNLQRIGLFLGQTNQTMNEFFSLDNGDKKNDDLYEVDAAEANSKMVAAQRSNSLKTYQKKQYEAAHRLAAFIGNFEKVKNEDGTYTFRMSRNSAKNPMTKVNYGSGVLGVARGIADDMILMFYDKIYTLENNQNLNEFFDYPGDMYADLQTMGLHVPRGIEGNGFEFSQKDIAVFQNRITQTIGKALFEATQGLMGREIIETNDQMVAATNIQMRYLQLKFQEMLDARLEELAEAGVVGRNKDNKPIKGQIPREELDAIVRELSSMAPLFTSEEQVLDLGAFAYRVAYDWSPLSSTTDGKLRQNPEIRQPELPGVKTIPYSVIGSGDAMMMNLFFSRDDAPNDVMGIFDGLDVPVNKLKAYSEVMNEQVLKSWERDVMGMGITNFAAFVEATESDPLLLEAFNKIIQDSKKDHVKEIPSVKELVEILNRRLEANRARKRAWKKIAVSVDQMAGGNVGFTREGKEVGFTELNAMIDRELRNRPEPEEQKVKTPVEVTTLDAVTSNIRWTAEQKKVVELIKPLLGNTRVVFGTIDQINEWRAENLPDDGEVMNSKDDTTKGMYDAQNDIIFMVTRDNSTLLHEMVHAATFNKVLSHYEGQRNEAVVRLEALMNEFLALESTGKNVREAQGAILQHLAKRDPFSKAAAINELMAYGLANAQVRTKLKKTTSNVFQNLAQKVVDLMRRLMGAIPVSMFDHLVFNTKVLVDGPIDTRSETPPLVEDQAEEASELTPSANKYTNTWIKMLEDYIAEIQDNTKAKLKQSKAAQQALAIVDSLRQVGMLRTPEAQATFRAIYGVLNSELKLNPQAMISLSKLFEHIDNALSPELFGTGPEAAQEYSAILSAMGDFRREGLINAIPVLFALSQTSEKFRAVLAQIPTPEGKAQQNEDLPSTLTRITEIMMSQITGSLESNKKIAQEVIDDLAAVVVDHNTEQEYAALRLINKGLDKGDALIGGALSKISGFMRKTDQQVKQSNRRKIVKYFVSTVTVGTNLLREDTAVASAKAAKQFVHLGIPIGALLPIRELVTEIIGMDSINSNVMLMLDKVNSAISGLRQAYREDLPAVLADLFKVAPTKEQWTALQKTLAYTDFTVLLKPGNYGAVIRMLVDPATRTQRLFQLEKQIQKKTGLPYIFEDAQKKSQQLADAMNRKGYGPLLPKNAYALVQSLDGEFDPDLVGLIDEYVSLLALNQMDNDAQQTVIDMVNEDPDGIRSLITYIHNLNKAEEAKGPSMVAKLNAWKGYLPNIGKKNIQIIVAKDSQASALEARGFVKLKPYEGDERSVYPRSYYVTTVRQKGAYSQGVMQNVASTYRGVDMNTGLSLIPEVTGYIGGDPDYINDIARDQAKSTYTPRNNQEVLVPVLGMDKGKVIVTGFERSVNPAILEQHAGREENLAVNIGAWAGRHVEEQLAYEYNVALVDELDRIYQNRDSGDAGMFINLRDTKDPIYQESGRLIPPAIKAYIDTKFDGNGLMVREDMINLSVGYREFSLADLWSGRTRVPKDARRLMTSVAELILGKKAMARISTGEELFQGTVSTAKDIIVIRSLIVPAMNLNANILQLATRGVPLKMQWKSFRAKTAEIEQYQKNLTKKIKLQHLRSIYANDATKVTKIDAQIQILDELNSKMTIAPMIEAGQYKQLSEGITDLDVSLSSGKFADYMEQLANKLPEGVGNVTKWGLVSKSTPLYKAANRATQYGDFLAKSILYDHLLSQGLTPEAAMMKVNEEFVNFSVLPGRTRSYMESVGLTWFMAFKIRIMKIGLNQIRENPFRAMLVNGLTDVGSPIQDNILTVLASDNRFDYATGWEMLFDAPELNPFINLLNG